MSTASIDHSVDPRLSINLATVRQLCLAEALMACRRIGAGAAGVWWDDVTRFGARRVRSLVDAAGLAVSGLSGVRMFDEDLVAGHGGTPLALMRRAIDDAASLGAAALVLLCGPCPERDLELGRERLAETLMASVGYAEAREVRLGLEPLHPYFAADRTIMTTLGEANDLADACASDVVGVIVDAYHVWWDPSLQEQLQRARGRIVGCHISDWTVPNTDVLEGRGMIGDGVIALAQLMSAVGACGYGGPVEVEIFNAALWKQPADDVLATVRERWDALVAGPHLITDQEPT